MATHEALKFFLAAASTSPAQPLTQGGEYVIDSVATGSGTIDVEKLGPDGTTWIDVVTQITSAAGKTQAVILSPGQYRVVSGTFTNTYVSIVRAPLN